MNLLTLKIWILVFSAFLAKSTGDGEFPYLQDTNYRLDLKNNIISIKDTLNITNDSLLKDSINKNNHSTPVNFKINNMIINNEKENKIDSLTKKLKP